MYIVQCTHMWRAVPAAGLQGRGSLSEKGPVLQTKGGQRRGGEPAESQVSHRFGLRRRFQAAKLSCPKEPRAELRNRPRLARPLRAPRRSPWPSMRDVAGVRQPTIGVFREGSLRNASCRLAARRRSSFLRASDASPGSAAKRLILRMCFLENEAEPLGTRRIKRAFRAQ